MFRGVCTLALLLGMPLSLLADDEAAVEVRRLVRQLDAPQLAQREAAEAELLRRGPAVLDLLPQTGDRGSAEVRQRLGRIRQKLQQMAADAVAKPSTITLQADGLRLSEILKAFQSQSGNTIVDFRREFGQTATDPTLNVHFDQTPFWPAVDQLLDQAGLALYPYGRRGAISIVAAHDVLASRQGLISYSGPFRFAATSVTARRDLQESNSGSLIVAINIAWEPRLRMITLVNRMADVAAVDENGEPLPVAQETAKPEAPTAGETAAVKLELPLRLPPRKVQQIASLKGKLQVTMPGRIETFRFENLNRSKNSERRIAGVTVGLGQVRRSGDVVEVPVRVQFDDAGDALASHRQWIFDNEAYVVSDGKPPVASEGFETTGQSENELELVYRFPTTRPLDELAFVYKTPGSIITSEFDYELKGIELP